MTDTANDPTFREGPPAGRDGFTLLELMIVVSVMSIMAAIALPKFADMLQKAQEGGTKGNLGAVRSALNIYYADNQGQYPTCAVAPASAVLQDSLVPKYLSSLQPVHNGVHPPTNSVYCDSVLTAGSVHDGQGWYYVGDQTDSTFGSVYVACDHTDTRGTFWTSY